MSDIIRKILSNKLNKYLCEILFEYVNYTHTKLHEHFNDKLNKLKIEHKNQINLLQDEYINEVNILNESICNTNKYKYDYNKVMDDLISKTIALKTKCNKGFDEFGYYKIQAFGYDGDILWS